MSSFERLSVLEQQRIKLEEAQMKKRVVEEKKKKEQEAKAREERLKQQQEQKLQKQSAAGQQQSTINSNVKDSNKRSSLPPTGQSNIQKRPTSGLKPNDQGINKQNKETATQSKQTGPIQMLKKVISLEDIEEQRGEIDQESQKYQQEKPKEIKNAYHNVVVKEYQKEQVDVKDQYLMQLQIQEQMKKIQKTQELKQQQAKQKNMLMKQQIIEEMLSQTNQNQKQSKSSDRSDLAGFKDQKNNQNLNDKQNSVEYQNDSDQEGDGLNNTVDYNNEKNKNNAKLDKNTQQRSSQNFKTEKQSLDSEQNYQQKEKTSKNQMYQIDSLNQLPPLKSMVEANKSKIEKSNSKQNEQSSQVQMVQSQNYVGDGELIQNYSKQNRESVLGNKAQGINVVSDSVQKSKLNAQDKSSQMLGKLKIPEVTSKNNQSQNCESKSILQRNSSKKTEFENISGKNSNNFDKADTQSKVSQLNKSVRDQIFKDEIDYTESLQVDAQFPFLEKSNKSHLKNSQNKSFSVQESQERASKVVNQDKQKSSFLKQKNKKKKYSSSPCIKQDDFDDSDQEESNQQQNPSNFNYQNNNESKISSESQNLNKNQSVVSNGSQRFIKSSAQNERFPIFNRGSQVHTNQEDSDTDSKKKSIKNLSEKSQNSNKQSGFDTQDVFENQQDDQGDNMLPKQEKIFQTFKSNPVQLQGNFYNQKNNDDYDSHQEDEQIENEQEEDVEQENFDNNQENQFEQTEFEDIGHNYIPPQRSAYGVKDSQVKAIKQQDFDYDSNQLKQLNDYSDQEEEDQNQSDDDKEELQDEASISTKLQGSKQTNEEPMIVSFGVQQNQSSFGKQNNLNESQKQKQSVKKSSYDEEILNENFQTFGARDSDKFLGLGLNNKEQTSVEIRKSPKPSQDFSATQKLPYCDKTAQFNDEVNPFKQLKQQMKQVKQSQQMSQKDSQKSQEFERKRQHILRDAEMNIKKVMNDQIKMADSNKFKFSEQEEYESQINNQSQKSAISQNKSAQSRAQLLDNMRKKKDQNIDDCNKSQQNNQDRFTNQSSSKPQFITQSNISDLKSNNHNNSDKMSQNSDNQSYLKNSFDMKFQEAYEQYDQSCNSQMIEGSPLQFVKNSTNDFNKKQINTNQEKDFVLKKSQQADSKSINIIHKPNYEEEEEQEDFWQKQKQTENKKRKVWGNQKNTQQNTEKQHQFLNNQSDKLSQSFGQTSNVISNQSNYHSKLQKLHESEEFQDNEFIELTLKQKIQDQNLKNSQDQVDSYKNNQPKLWATRNINAGSNRGGYKGYSQNGNQLEMEREDQEDYESNQGYGQNYNNQYRNYYNQDNDDNEEEDDYEQEDENDENYSQNYQNNYNRQNQQYDQGYADQDYDESTNNYNDNYPKQYKDEDENQYQNKGFQQQRNSKYGRHQQNEEEEDEEENENNSNNYDNDQSNNDNTQQYDEEDNSQNDSPQKQEQNLNESNDENNLNQNNKSSKQEEEEEEEQKQLQKGVAMTIDFGDKDDDELEKKKKAFELKRLKKIQELELQKQKKQQEIQQKQLQQADDQNSAQKEKKYAHKKQPSYQVQQKQKMQQDNQAISENNTPSNKQIIKKANDNSNQYVRNQQNIFSVNQKDQMINQNSPKSKSPIRQQQVKEKVKLPVINKKKENIAEEENKSDIQENFTPKISVLENPTTKPRIPFSKPSNKQLISQAITKVCLAGPTNIKEREIALKKIKDSQQEHFIVLFKGINGRQDFKALYSMDSNTAEVKKLFGLNTAPGQIDLTSVQAFYRYDSGSKEFKEILVKAFSNQVDAVLLKK